MNSWLWALKQDENLLLMFFLTATIFSILNFVKEKFCHSGFCVRSHIASWDSNQSAKHREKGDGQKGAVIFL